MATILIDNGHGAETLGKQSPDGKLKEWEWTRRCASRVCNLLNERGINARKLVEETADIALAERVRRVNAVADATLVVSIHVNAAGNGSQWLQASGFSAYVAPRCSADSRRLGAIFHRLAAERGLKGNRWLPTDTGLTGNFAIVRDTRCPAVLTENLFMDNASDASLLLTDEGLERLALLHADAIELWLAEG